MNWYKLSQKCDCFGDVAHAATRGGKGLPREQLERMDEIKIVHGSVIGGRGQRIDHAWLELRAGNYWFVWESQNGKLFPRDSYYKIVKAQAKYSMEVDEMYQTMIRAKTPGPFTDEERIRLASKKEYLDKEERELVKELFGNVGCTFAKDKDGYYCFTHRARSESYSSLEEIPEDEVDWIESTG